MEYQIIKSYTFEKNILPNQVWVTGLHSHFVKSDQKSPLGFPNYSNEDFENYASIAYLSAQKAGLSAWAITDYNFDAVRWTQKLYPKKTLKECTKIWESTAFDSANHNTKMDNFLALTGFEYGKSINFSDLPPELQEAYKDRQNYKGHIDTFGDIVIFNAPFISPNQGQYDIMNNLELQEVYQYIKNYPLAFGIFAHPAAYPVGKGNAFKNFYLYPDFTDQMVGFELWNGCYMVYKQQSFLNEFITALQNGWQVGVMYNPDNVWPNWGCETHENYSLGFTIIIGNNKHSSKANLTQEQLFDQIRKRKFYGSILPNLVIGIVTEEGATIGDTLCLSKKTKAYIQASGVQLASVKLFWGTVGNKNLEINIIPYSSDQTLEVTIPVPSVGYTQFFFVEFRDSFEKPIGHSTPIWVKNKNN